MIRHPSSAWALLLAVGLAACPQPDPEPPPPDGPLYAVRDCTARFTFRDEASHTRVVVSGDFNGWSETADRLVEGDDGTWSLALELPPGDYAYKLIVDGAWVLDPANPFTVISDGVENSRLVVSDCAAPALAVDAFSADPDGTVHLEASFQAAASLAAPDPAAMVATLDGEAAAADVDAEHGTLTLDLAGVAEGKHTLEVRAADAAGAEADPLYLPFWIEAEPFDWSGMMYFAFVDRFRDGDASNDDAAPDVAPIANYQGGDWAGLKAAVDEGYFDALGVDVLWITAPQANPDGAFSGLDGRSYTGYHGYWPSAARTPQRRFGTMDDLRALTRAAHAHGIRVVADLVLNHVHAEHPYYAAHAADGWFNGDGSCVCGGQSCDWDGHALDCWFTSYLPDWNWTNEDVLDTVLDDALWWVKAADLDGFRVDAVKHFQKVAVRNLRGRLAEIEARTGLHYYLVGETYTWDDGYGLISQYVDRTLLDGQFDFPLYWNAVRTFARGEETMRGLDDAVKRGESDYPQGALNSPFLGNHDVPRLYSHAAGDIADLAGGGAQEQGWTAPPAAHLDEGAYRKVRLAFAFLLTQPGLPLVYYGDEIAMPGAGDPDNRRAMRFGAELAPYERTVLETVQRLGTLRQELDALRTGARRTLWVDDDVYAYVRDAGGEDVALVVLNRSDVSRTITVTFDGELAGVSGLAFADRLGGGHATAQGGRIDLTIPAATAQLWTPMP